MDEKRVADIYGKHVYIVSIQDHDKIRMDSPSVTIRTLEYPVEEFDISFSWLFSSGNIDSKPDVDEFLTAVYKEKTCT